MSDTTTAVPLMTVAMEARSVRSMARSYHGSGEATALSSKGNGAGPRSLMSVIGDCRPPLGCRRERLVGHRTQTRSKSAPDVRAQTLHQREHDHRRTRAMFITLASLQRAANGDQDAGADKAGDEVADPAGETDAEHSEQIAGDRRADDAQQNV